MMEEEDYFLPQQETFYPLKQLDAAILDDEVDQSDDGDEDSAGVSEQGDDDQDNQDQEEHTDHEGNMRRYIETYGTEFDISGSIIQDTVLYPQAREFAVQVLRYVVPQDKDNKISWSTDQDIYTEPKYIHASLRLLKIKKTIIEVEKEIAIPKAQKYVLSFSPDGQYLIIFMKNLLFKYNGEEADKIHNRLDVYKIEDGDVEATFDQIDEGIEPYGQFFSVNFDSRLKDVKKLTFSTESKFLVCQGRKNASFIQMEGTNEKAEFLSFKFQLELKKAEKLSKFFDKILDIHMSDGWENDEEPDAENEDEYKIQKSFDFRCQVACNDVDQTSVIVFNIEQDQKTVFKDSQRRVMFSKPIVNKNLMAKISTDFSAAMIGTDDEKFLLERSTNNEDGVEFDIVVLFWCGQKIIQKIVNCGAKEFLFIVCNPYDRDLEVQASYSAQFSYKIPMMLSPGSIKVLDTIQFCEQLGNDSEEVEADPEEPFVGQQETECLTLVCMRDTQIFVNKVSLVHRTGQKNLIQQYYMSETEGLKFNWPYLTYKGFKNDMVIINMATKDTCFNVELPEYVKKVSKSFITEAFDLYVLAEDDESYYLLHIDLDKFKDDDQKKDQIFRVKEKFDFSKDLVDNKMLFDFHVRSSSNKEKISTNKKLQAFFLFDGALYTWCSGQQELQLKMNAMGNSIERINDENICVATIEETKDKQIFKYVLVKIQFGSSEVQDLYTDKQEIEVVRAFGFDEQQQTLVLLKQSKLKNTKSKNYKISIVDIRETEENELFNQEVENEDLIGRLINNRYEFKDGHMYYSNNVIKVRYDILRNKSKSSGALEENQAFDFFTDLLTLGDNQKIHDDMPLNDYNNHRLVYVCDQQDQGTFHVSKKVLVLPYLHERKVYFNQPQKDCDYFQTAHEVQFASGEVQFISMNLTDNKYHIYNMKGILEHRVNFNDQVLEYGHEQAVSNNGKIFLFKKKKSLTYHVLILRSDKFQHIKDIKVAEAIDEYVSKLVDTTGNQEDTIREDLNLHDEGIYRHYREKKIVQMEAQINDSMDVCVMIKPDSGDNKTTKNPTLITKKLNLKNSFQAEKMFGGIIGNIKEKLEDQADRKLIYIEDGRMNVDSDVHQSLMESDIRVLKTSSVVPQENQEISNLLFQTHFDKEGCPDTSMFNEGFQGFAMNQKSVFFWNESRIWCVQINNPDVELEYLGFAVSKDNKQTKIKRVRTGSDPHKIGIFVKQSQTESFFILWDTDLNIEIESFDTGSKAKMFWDELGNAYVTEDDKVIMASQGLSLKCFDVTEVNELNQKKQTKQAKLFGTHQGFKFDGESHNWMYLQSYISLGISYMTSVINKQMQSMDVYMDENYLFDPEQYNYVLNKKSALTDQQLLVNPDKLEYILSNFAQIDLVFLEMLQYYYLDENNDNSKTTPLHIAFQKQNNKCINIVLKYLSQIEYAQFGTFSDILPELIEYTQFPNFFSEQTFQTLQMSNKQSMKVKQAFSDTIVSMNSASSSFVDEDYFIEMLGEQEDNQDANSYAVRVTCLQIDWILKDRFGYRFLKRIYDSNNLELYNVEPVMVLIEFLFEKYKRRAVKWRAPLYLAQVATFLLTACFNEHMLNERKRIEEHQSIDQSKLVENDEFYAYSRQELAINIRLNSLLGFCNLALAIFSICFMVKQTMMIKKRYIFTKWAFCDGAYSLITLVTAYLIYCNSSDKVASLKNLRRLGAINSLIVCSKGIYFLELHEQISPMIKSIISMITDVVNFAVLLLITLFAFSTSFYIVGRNQLQFDGIFTDGNEVPAIPMYATRFGSLIYIYQMSLGEVGFYDFYDAGNNPNHSLILWTLFIAASFIIIIAMMNMLVAIMTNSFETNQEVQDLLILKSKLSFIIDNFKIFDPFGDDKHKISYIVSALLNEEEEEQIELINYVNTDFDQLREEHKKNTQNILSRLHKLSTKVKKLRKI